MTDDDILDGSIPARFDRWRFDVLDASHGDLGTVTPDKPVTITNDTGRNIRRSMTGFSLSPDVLADIDVSADRIRPTLILQNGSEFPLGVFVFTDGNRFTSTAGESGDFTLADEGYLMDQPRGNIVSLSDGTYPLPVIYDLMAEIGITAYDFDAPLLGFTGAAMSWPSGTSPWRIIIDLVPLLGLLPPYFSNTGELTLRPVPWWPTADPVAVYGPGGVVVAESITTRDFLLSSPNRWVVVANQPTGSPIVGIYDLPDSAPNSYAARGYYVKRIVPAQGVTDVTSAELEARRAATLTHRNAQEVYFDALINPRHDTFDAVEWDGSVWEEQSWTIGQDGVMEHRLAGRYE